MVTVVMVTVVMVTVVMVTVVTVTVVMVTVVTVKVVKVTSTNGLHSCCGMDEKYSRTVSRVYSGATTPLYLL